MKIAVCNASPKYNNSTSGILAGYIHSNIHEPNECVDVNIHANTSVDDCLNDLENADTWVLVFPVYIDGIPGHLLSVLAELESKKKRDGISVYAVVNLGFYEGKQGVNALNIIGNWCARCGFQFKGGLSFGGGGGLSLMPNMEIGKGPVTTLGMKLGSMCEAMNKDEAWENEYICMDFPRFLYMMGAHMGWTKLIKANGLKKKDLGRKIAE